MNIPTNVPQIHSYLPMQMVIFTNMDDEDEYFEWGELVNEDTTDVTIAKYQEN